MTVLFFELEPGDALVSDVYQDVFLLLEVTVLSEHVRRLKWLQLDSEPAEVFETHPEPDAEPGYHYVLHRPGEDPRK